MPRRFLFGGKHLNLRPHLKERHMLDMTGKVAIVTGAGSVGPGWGNGKATATLLARQGAAVLLVDIDEPAAQETRAIIETEGNRCAVHRCDMLRPDQVQAMVQACLDRFSRIDILVNNVGGSAPGDPVTMPEEVWDRQIDFNLKTVFLGCKYVVPVMQAQKQGAIVNISSVAGLRNDGRGGRQHVAYSASKAAVIQFSRATAGAFVKHGIRCNTVVPGLMHTPLVEQRLAKTVAGGDAQALIASRNARCPMGRMGTAWDVAHAVLFLASDEANYITGAEIVVDGGLTLASP
ncbi:MAG: SDR family NAD(P)-dependent oxidoreductase [Acetobacteraceae bacterium]